MIDPKCDRCGEELKQPGGLVFSPPNEQGMVRKFHLCILCWIPIAMDIKTSIAISSDDVNWSSIELPAHPVR